MRMHEKGLEEMKSAYKEFQLKVMRYQNDILKTNKYQPLDYILHFDDKKLRRKNRRKMVLKNVVAQIMKEVEIQKKKPKLRDLLKAFKAMGREQGYKRMM